MINFFLKFSPRENPRSASASKKSFISLKRKRNLGKVEICYRLTRLNFFLLFETSLFFLLSETRLLVSGQSPECCDCLLRSMEQ